MYFFKTALGNIVTFLNVRWKRCANSILFSFLFFFQSTCAIPVICYKQKQTANEEEVWSSVHSGYHSDILQVNLNMHVNTENVALIQNEVELRCVV